MLFIRSPRPFSVIRRGSFSYTFSSDSFRVSTVYLITPASPDTVRSRLSSAPAAFFAHEFLRS